MADDTSRPKGGIQPIDAASVHRIHSGQVILTLESALKELVENSMDAGATSIEVRIKDNGLESIEVSDNGSGVAEADWENLGLKHRTSKLSSFEELSLVTTFGFRGEALSSLCALSESVTFTTAVAETAPLGTILRFDRRGALIDASEKVARQRGTTVLATKLFSPLPVRRKEFERNAKRELAKALSLLTAYALVPSCSEAIRLTVDTVGKNGKKTNHLRSDGKTSLRGAVAAVWGAKAVDNLVEVDMELDVEIDKSMAKREGIDLSSQKVLVKGLISSAAFGCGRTSADRQYFYINGRPFAPSKIAKAINETYRSFNTNQSPFLVLDFQMPRDAVDVNVSPDKREIFVHSEANLLEALRLGFDALFQPTRSTFADQGVGASVQPVGRSGAHAKPLDPKQDENENKDEEPGVSRPTSDLDARHETEAAMSRRDDSRRKRKRSASPAPSLSPNLSSRPFRRYDSGHAVTPDPDTDEDVGVEAVGYSARTTLTRLANETRKLPSVAPQPRFRQATLNFQATAAEPQDGIDSESEQEDSEGSSRQIAVPCVQLFTLPKPPKREMEVDGNEASDPDVSEDESSDGDAEPQQRAVSVELIANDPAQSAEADADDDVDEVNKIEEEKRTRSDLEDAQPLQPRADEQSLAEILSKTKSRSIAMTCRIQDIAIVASRVAREGVVAVPDQDSDALDAGVEQADSERAEKALSHVLLKQDFGAMTVLGQYNKAFIIARRTIDGVKERSDSDDLFIIDQHASDEKYNFETLQATTKILGQRLIVPRRLELTSADEITAVEHLDILAQNGFELEVDQEAPFGRGERIKLVAMPTSKETVFDAKDLEELIFLLQDHHRGSMVRCKKARAMFAMRACRKSVMFGKPLNKSQMTMVTRHMGTIDQPWNCPHGRPTMRHLINLDKVRIDVETANRAQKIDWSSVTL